jgi:hypothetical protein
MTTCFMRSTWDRAWSGATMPERPPNAQTRNIELCGDLILRDLAAGDEPAVQNGRRIRLGTSFPRASG